MTSSSMSMLTADQSKLTASYHELDLMLVVGVKSNLGCEAGCGVTVSCSDHSRIMLGSFSERSRIGRAL